MRREKAIAVAVRRQSWSISIHFVPIFTILQPQISKKSLKTPIFGVWGWQS